MVEKTGRSRNIEVSKKEEIMQTKFDLVRIEHYRKPSVLWQWLCRVFSVFDRRGVLVIALAWWVLVACASFTLLARYDYSKCKCECPCEQHEQAQVQMVDPNCRLAEVAE